MKRKIVPSDLSGQAAIISYGYEIVNTKLGDKAIGGIDLQARACARAIRNAGLQRKDIGAFFTGRPPNENVNSQWSMVMIEALGITPKLSTSITIHGAGHLSSLKYATLAVCSGLVDYALCVSGSLSPLWVEQVKTVSFFETDPQFESCYFPITPTVYAQFATRYAHEHGITERQAAKVAVEARKWGVLHPKAAMKDKGLITIDDVLTSPMISSPFHMLDCAPWYPGGSSVAVVITRAELAAKHTDKPIYIKGFGEHATHESVTARAGLANVAPARGDVPNFTTSGVAIAAQDAYKMAGWTPKDLDIVESQAPFTYILMMAIEDLGLCGKGEAGKFVENGGIDFEMARPAFNTSGGMLSFGQPSNTNPLLIEAIQQLRGEAMGKQVSGAKNAAVHFHGGPFASHAVMMFTTKS